MGRRRARENRIGFVGIGKGRAAQRLRERGATEVFEDYADGDRVFSAMLMCAVILSREDGEGSPAK